MLAAARAAGAGAEDEAAASDCTAASAAVLVAPSAFAGDLPAASEDGSVRLEFLSVCRTHSMKSISQVG